MEMTTDQPTEAWPDDRLVARRAAGEHWALGPLYRRHISPDRELTALINQHQRQSTESRQPPP